MCCYHRPTPLQIPSLCQGVDLEYEARAARCARCQEQLQRLVPPLHALAAANPGAGQLAGRIADLAAAAHPR